MSSKRHLRGSLTIAMLSMTVGAGLAMAQTNTDVSRADRTFIRKAAEGNVAEVALGRLAQQTGQDPNVKAFGEHMVRDHTQANEQLASVAQSLSVTLPNSPSTSDQAKMDKLSRLSGADFDKAFAREMVRDHRTAIRAFEHEAKDGRDSAAKQFAESTLPTLKEHLAMAEKLPGAQRRTASAGASNQTETR